MKVVLSWLREFCPTDLPAEELADRLSVKGVHVEAVLRPWDRLSRVVVARVLEVRDHPRSEKLCVARVDDGSWEREVVVGVRNMRAGDLVPLAAPGATVPTLPEPIGAKTVRGVESDGMLCSPFELGISPDHSGILILAPETPLGADVKEQLGLDDAVLDVEIEANRPDLMSVFGVAREVAAATGVELVEPDVSVLESSEKAEEAATLEVLDPERCPQYVARVIRGVRVGPSPLRVQARLTAAGMRPLSNVVDATNYAMLEMGQPLHAFDLHRLAGRGIVVRRAEDGEALVSLDDVERTLTSEDLVIADHERAVAIAGVMGSASAEVSESTTEVLLESAYFERRGVIRTSRRLGLQSEASLRFGRGADPENPSRGAALAARLMSEWAGGSVLAGEVRVGEPPERRWVAVRPSRASLVIGYPVSGADAEAAFARLGLRTRPAGEDSVEVEIPGYRVDLDREVDLIEEIVRVQGYDRLSSTMPAIRQIGSPAPTYALRRRIRSALVRAGLREALSLSFASSADLSLMGHREGVRLANPPTADQPYLRASLVPGLLRALQRNVTRGVRGAALFEVGHVFRPGDQETPVDERESAAAALAGSASVGFPDPARSFDFFDAKGAVEGLMESLAVTRWDLGELAGSSRALHPARSASIIAAGHRCGIIGELHPRVAESLDLPDRTAVFEVDVGVLGRNAGTVGYREVSRFPPLRRDLAFVVDAAAAVGELVEAIERSSGGLADSVVLFDVFTGGPVPEGKKSVAFSVDFRAPNRTLKDREVNEAISAIAAFLAATFGAELRAG